MTRDEEIRRGDEAKRLIEHPLVVEAFEICRQDIMDTWAASPARDTEGRETLWLTLKCLNKVHAQLESVMSTGQMARTLAERAKRRLGRSTSR